MRVSLTLEILAISLNEAPAPFVTDFRSREPAHLIALEEFICDAVNIVGIYWKTMLSSSIEKFQLLQISELFAGGLAGAPGRYASMAPSKTIVRDTEFLC